MRLKTIRMDARARADLSRCAALTEAQIVTFGMKERSGLCNILAVMDGADRIGSAVTSCFEGALIVNAYAVDPGHGDTLLKVLPILHDTAKRMGLRHVRFWTRHEAMARRAAAHGFALNYVCEREV